MRGRGLLIAAAVLQLVGAAMGLVGALGTLMRASTDMPGARGLYMITAVDTAIAAVMIPASIALILRKRWGWYVSIMVTGLFCLAIVAMPVTGALSSGAFGVGFGEMIIIVILAAPIFATVGLLIGGRHAVFAPKTAAEPMVVTPPRDD